MKLKLLLALMLGFFVAGCGQKEALPDALALVDVPAALRKAFANAEQNLQRRAEQIAMAIEENKLPAASIQLSTLAAAPNLKPEQLVVVNQATVAVNQQLQEWTQGPQTQSEVAGSAATPANAPTNPQQAAEAAAVLQYYQSTK